MHATVLAMIALAVSQLGMAPGPFVTGLLAGLCFLAANRHYRKNAERFYALPESGTQALEEAFLQVDQHDSSHR